MPPRRRVTPHQNPNETPGGSNGPEAEIRDRISRQGKITFAEFMELALYYPRGGYYSNASAFGATGDYFTSPAAHPAFGALLATQFRKMWNALNRPHPFYIVEVGAGSGIMARDVTEYASRMSGEFARCLRYMALERYAPPDAKLASHSDVAWAITEGIPLNGLVGCIVSNELLDSFPVHRFQVDQGRIMELYVTLDDSGAFSEVLGEPSTLRLSQRLEDLGVRPPEGFQGEINLEIEPWIRDVSAALERGFVVTIDYGAEAGDLYSGRRTGSTLQTLYQHGQGGSPYQRIGRQDISAHVDYSSVAAAGRSSGLSSLGLRTQRQLLADLGFETMVKRLRAMKLSQRDHDANLMAIFELIKPNGLGAFRVLIQERATGIRDLDQLRASGYTMDEIDVPLLAQRHMPLMEGRYPHLAWDLDELWPFDGGLTGPPVR